MEPILDETAKVTYDTLPELLRDLQTLAQASLDEETHQAWTAIIDCGGDFHQLRFYSGGCQPFVMPKNDNTMTQTYENLDSLLAEYDHVKDFLENANVEDLGEVTNIGFVVSANGGRPVIRITLCGRLPMSEEDKELAERYATYQVLRQYSQTFLHSLIALIPVIPFMFFYRQYCAPQYNVIL